MTHHKHNKEFYGRSRPSTRIACFWSHSWHGSTLLKIHGLLLRNIISVTKLGVIMCVCVYIYIE